MSSIPNPPNLLIFSPTHPTPFLPTPRWPGRTLDVIAPIHLLDPPSTVTGLGVGFKPNAGFFVRSKVLVAEMGPVLHAGEIGMRRGATLEA